MDRSDPRDAGYPPGKRLDDRGRVSRWAAGDGELWRFEDDHRRVAERLYELSRCGVGGFVQAGIDADGVWLVRLLPSTTLDELRRAQPGAWPHDRTLHIALAVARALAACEERSLFPGPVIPKSLAVSLADDEAIQVILSAEALIGAMVGDRAGGAGGETGTKALTWLPPEKVDTATWDNAANRYALGVMIYELIAGHHPFGGAGLRHALREAREAEAAPFPKAIRRELPAGLQSLVLRMIAPASERRPDAAAGIVDELEALVSGKALQREPAATAPVPKREDEGSCERRPSLQPDPLPRGRAEQILDLGWLLGVISTGRWRLLPLAVGLAACAVALVFAFDEPPPREETRPEIAAQRVVDDATLGAGDCASCHPKHAAEWSQSVMGHSVKSPLFNALESLIEEQVGRSDDCPGGAGILRRAGPSACRADNGLPITGSGGEHWCVNCHAPGDNIRTAMPAWNGLRGGDPRSRLPVKDLINEVALEGISCAFCHQVHGPVGPNGSAGYQGNPSWRSFVTGVTFPSRPEDRRGLFGIANSGYRLDAAELLFRGAETSAQRIVFTASGYPVHARPTEAARRYLQSSEFCGSCHDVRLFGTDVLGARKGEHFKRLRNAYSEWATWADAERAGGRQPATCQGCHMSTYPGICVLGDAPDDDPIHGTCPDGMHFEPHEPGRKVSGRVAINSGEISALSPHTFAGVDLPLALDIADEALDHPGVDANGMVLSARARRDQLLMKSMSLRLAEAKRVGATLEVDVSVENIGAGHKIPAGFSQEREIWVHLRITDAGGGVLYEVGRVDRNDEDLKDKIFDRVNTDPDRLDALGRPEGIFGADVRDGPDAPAWSPPPELGGQRFRGKGLINFQNGFLRCVRCLGDVSPSGECIGTGFERHHAEKFADGDYDIDTGECRSNLSGRAALFEVYFPVGALDASRGLPKGPDAIIDTRSLLPHRPVRYTYVLPTRGLAGPYRVEARLMFRSFPPFLVKAFAGYEQKMAARGRRPSGPLVTFDMLRRLERVELAKRTLVVP